MAKKSSAGIVIRRAQTGRSFTSLVVKPAKAHDHATSIANARAAGRRAVDVGTRIAGRLGQKIVGAASRGLAPTPGAKLTTSVLLQRANVAVKAGQAALKSADAHERYMSGYVAKMRANTRNAQLLTKIHGDDASSGGSSNSADGNAPDPYFGLGTPPTSAPPLVPGVDYVPDPYPNGDDPSFYDAPTDADLPLGAIVFDGSQVPPFLGLGNYTVFFGQMPGGAPVKGGPHSGYSFHKPGDGSDSGWWLELMGTQPSFGYNGNHNFDHIDNFGAWAVDESKKGNNGPLMGNPQGGWTKGLRYSPSGPSGPRWFWYRDLAPSWATSASDTARYNQSILDFKAAIAAAAADAASQAAQDKLDAASAAQIARQQAVDDAALAHQQAQQQLASPAPAYGGGGYGGGDGGGYGDGSGAPDDGGGVDAMSTDELNQLWDEQEGQ